LKNMSKRRKRSNILHDLKQGSARLQSPVLFYGGFMRVVIRLFVCFFIFQSLCFTQICVVAVTPFEVIGESSRADVLSHGLAQAIANDLSQLPDIQVAERLQLSAVLQELRLQQAGLVNTQNAAAVGELLGANLIMVGSVQDIQGVIRIQVRAVQTESGKVLFGVENEGPVKTVDDFFSLEDKVTRGIVLHLGYHIAQAELDAVEKKATDSDDAFQAYSSALKHFDAGETDSGLDAIEKAQQADPAFNWANDIRIRAQQAFEELEREVEN